jgi:hypothetical protein
MLAAADDRGEAVESQASFVLILPVARDAWSAKAAVSGAIKSGGSAPDDFGVPFSDAEMPSNDRSGTGMN